jgi:NAD(P)-dependent dehydrogenase (short-subunit alcohol dehydrogenase family)
MGELTNKTALVTGGGSGIGRAAALALAAAGAAVALSGRRADRLAETADRIRAAGGEAFCCTADLTSRDGVADTVKATLAHFGRLDIGFNNAGYQEPRQLLAEQVAAEYDLVFDTNVRAVFLCMQQQIQAMPNGGVIINNASVSGSRNPNPGLALYAASKAAVISLTRSAAMEYRPRGIRINAVSPGRVVTDMMLNAGIADPTAIAAGLPLRRMGQPEDVAAAVLFLASERSAFLCGHVIAVDGGFLAQ